MSKLISAIERLGGFVRSGRFATSERGESLLSFAMLLPLLIAISLGVLEFSLLMFDFHRAGEATRRVARLAALGAPVADVRNLSGAAVIACTGSGASVTCSGAAGSASAFQDLLTSAQAILPAIQSGNLRVEYRASGLGDAQTPGGILPLVTVKLMNLDHKFVMPTVLGLPNSLTFPPFTSSMLAGGQGGAS